MSTLRDRLAELPQHTDDRAEDLGTLTSELWRRGDGRRHDALARLRELVPDLATDQEGRLATVDP